MLKRIKGFINTKKKPDTDFKGRVYEVEE